MNDYNSDQAKELRRARLLKVKPKAAPTMMTESEFNREFVEYRFVSMERMSDLEEVNNVLFCPACAKNVNSVMGKRRVLHVSYEDDPLGNYPLIAVAKCQGCDWEEMIPVIKEELTSEQVQLVRRFRNAQIDRLTPREERVAVAPSPSPPRQYSDQVMKAFKEMPKFVMEDAVPPPAMRFGQNKADRVWADFANHERVVSDYRTAVDQIKHIERYEAEQRARTQARTVAKSTALGMAYGMGSAGVQKMMDDYRNAVGRQMVEQLDSEMLRQMQNVSFSYEEIEQIKREPAAAAKAAHKTLGDHIKVLRDKFDKRDRK